MSIAAGNPRHVVLVTDEGYSAFAAVACLTLLRSCQQPSALWVHLLHDGLPAALGRRFDDLVRRHGSNLRLYDVGLRVRRDDHYRRRSAHYHRLLAPEILPPQVGRFVYLDSDLLVYRDLGELFSRDLGGQPVAACRDYLGDVVTAIGNHRQLGLEADAPYFNSGVMVIDRRAWVDGDVSRRVLETTDRNRAFLDALGKYHQYDQYGLNVVFHGRWHELPDTWNYGVELPYREVAIAHFNGHGKPWSESCAALHRDHFYACLKRTGWQARDLPAPSAAVYGARSSTPP